MTEPLTRIEQALTQLGSEHRPPEGWEARVLAATRQPQPAKRRWHLVILSVLAFAAVLALWLVIGARDRGRDGALELALSFDKPGTAVRSVASPHAGDIAHVRATGGRSYRAIWIYRDDQLVIACPGWDGPGWCRVEREASISDVPLGAGRWEFLVLGWSAPLPPSTGSFDRDMSWARAAGVELRERARTIQ